MELTIMTEVTHVEVILEEPITVLGVVPEF